MKISLTPKHRIEKRFFTQLLAEFGRPRASTTPSKAQATATVQPSADPTANAVFDRSAIHALLSAMDVSMSDEEFEGWFARADRDHSGMLARDELVPLLRGVESRDADTATRYWVVVCVWVGLDVQTYELGCGQKKKKKKKKKKMNLKKNFKNSFCFVCCVCRVWQYLSDHCRLSHSHHSRSASGLALSSASTGSSLLMEGVSQPRSGEYIWVRERVHGRRVKENIPKYISVALKSMFGTG